MPSYFNSKIIKIDSSKAHQYLNSYNTSFTFIVDPPICVAHDEVIVYSLLNVWIPYSFYSVSKYNQYLDVGETVNGLATTRTVVFPAGNYNTYDWAKVFSATLSTAKIQYTCVYNRNNNRYTVACSAGASAVFFFASGPNASASCYKLMGFPQTDTPITSVGVLTGCVTMNDIYYFQIKSDLGDANIFLTGDGYDSLLEVIPVSAEPLAFVSYAPFVPNKFIVHNNSINAIRISLIDNYGRDVNLNGIPFLLTIKIDIISPEDAGVTRSMGRNAEGKAEQIIPDQEKTNLQMIQENPGIIMRPKTTNNGLSMNDYIEYTLIQKMLQKEKRKEKMKKSKK